MTDTFQRRDEELTRDLLAIGGPNAQLLSDAMNRHQTATVGELSRRIGKDHPEFSQLRDAVRRLLDETAALTAP
jgi:hypothetical protein